MPAKLHFVTAPQGAPIIFCPRLSYAVPDSDEVKRHKMSLRWGNETVARTKTKETEKHKTVAKNGNGANLGFEAQLFLAADKLRKNLEPSDYKHVALGLIFLKHISNAFEAKRAALLAEDATAAEDPDEYLAENVFWVPKEARWSHLQANAKQHTIGKLIDEAMAAIETHNPGLKGVPIPLLFRPVNERGRNEVPRSAPTSMRPQDRSRRRRSTSLSGPSLAHLS